MVKNTSYWLDSAPMPARSAFYGERKCDIAIIGGGLTGVTAALLLAQKGFKSVLLEADQLGGGASGRTTAKVTVQHGLKYNQILSQFGKEAALHYYRANLLGQQKIAELVDTLGLDCDYRGAPTYVYANNPMEALAVETEYRALQSLSLPCRLSDKCPLPFPVLLALAMDDQAVFHPLKYLHALAERAQSHCDIYENSAVWRIEGEAPGPYIVRTAGGALYAKKIILATNYPLMDAPGLYFLRLHQERSYLVAKKAGELDIEGGYINAGEPVNSFCLHYGKEGAMILVGGYGHRTGMKEHTGQNYDALTKLLRETFSLPGGPDYLWSAQDTVTLDGLPYIGPLSDKLPGVYIASGYDKWGMTGSNMAAQLLTALLTDDTEHPLLKAQELFSPRRFTPLASAKQFLTHGATVVLDFLAGNLAIPAGDPADLKKGQGQVILHSGRALALYRDEQGRLTALNHHCTHLGCPVSWNEEEKSWDCPCHGSRFATDGNILSGPALKPLEKIELAKEEK